MVQADATSHRPTSLVEPHQQKVAATPEVVALQASMWVVPTAPLAEGLVYRFVKRVADIIIAGISIVILSPVLAAIAALVRLEDGGPVLFVQSRVGRYGVPIRFPKFRSMCINAEALKAGLQSQKDSVGVAFKMKNDPRVTKIGRFIRKYSLDELPQLFSVLAGDMSIVGPRPLPLSEGYACGDGNAIRYLVKPGLICFREVSGRSRLTFAQWMSLDVEYVNNRSLLLDLKILMMLIPALITGDGAF